MLNYTDPDDAPTLAECEQDEWDLGNHDGPFKTRRY